MTEKSSKLLINENPLMVLPELAKLIGFNEAIVLQQVHYWIKHFEIGIAKGLYRDHVHDEKIWVYNTHEEWRENFPFWSVSTIRRAITNLEGKAKDISEKKYKTKSRQIKNPILLAGNFNKFRPDNTKWYTIDYDELNRLIAENEATCSKLTGVLFKIDRPIPETIQQRLSKNNNGVIALSADKDNPSLRVDSLLGKDRAGDGVDVEMVDNPIDDLSLQGNDPSTIARLESRRDVEGALEFYFQMYPQKMGEDHPHLVEDQLLEVIKKLISEGLSLDEWKKVITHWFNCVNIETDYNINHFVSGQIIQNRMFELEKCGKCQSSKWNN